MRPDPRRGFTLIELLVALVLLVIVGGIDAALKFRLLAQNIP